MKVALYPGSFNPWHVGHTDVMEKALGVFDKIIIAVGVNPEKTSTDIDERVEKLCKNPHIAWQIEKGKVEVKSFEGLLVNFVKTVDACAIIRGLRNGHDLQYEMNQQYWNEDLGIEIPFVYFITDREYAHISSSMYRLLNTMK
jgi:pantetheine-phosphate adenylyltransferase